MSESHYELLGVESDASKDEIRSAYRERIEDLRGKVENGRSDQVRNGARAETARLNSAWQVLADPFQRQRYDTELTGGSDGTEAEEEDEEEEEEAAPAPARRRGLFEPRERDGKGRPQRREPVGVPGAEPAPLGRRLAALGIDVLTMGAVFLGVTSLLVSVASDSVGAIILLVTALFVLFNAYFVFPTARSGQTLGKRFTHIMVVDADTGELPTWRRASLRYIVPIVLVIGLPGSLGLMGALLFGISWVLIDTRDRADGPSRPDPRRSRPLPARTTSVGSVLPRRHVGEVSMKYVYAFEEGGKDQKYLLGGKGANLAEMTNLGLPVPPGFTITTEACNAYMAAGDRLPDGLMDEVAAALETLEGKMGKRLGDDADPLLVSVRSGAPFSMPGMMDTVLNLGLNDRSVGGLAKQTGNERFAYDSYRRFVQMFGKIVLDIDGELFEDELEKLRHAARSRNRSRAVGVGPRRAGRDVQGHRQAGSRRRLPAGPQGAARATRSRPSSRAGTASARATTAASRASPTTSAPP